MIRGVFISVGWGEGLAIVNLEDLYSTLSRRQSLFFFFTTYRQDHMSTSDFMKEIRADS